MNRLATMRGLQKHKRCGCYSRDYHTHTTRTSPTYARPGRRYVTSLYNITWRHAKHLCVNLVSIIRRNHNRNWACNVFIILAKFSSSSIIWIRANAEELVGSVTRRKFPVDILGCRGTGTSRVCGVERGNLTFELKTYHPKREREISAYQYR